MFITFLLYNLTISNGKKKTAKCFGKTPFDDNLLYKDKKPSVCLSAFFWCHADNLVMSAWIDSRLGLYDSYDLWHKQVCFYKFLRPICWAQEHLKTSAVVPFCLA